jgi:HAD superfamily hydrolase (TIGR01509 family)
MAGDVEADADSRVLAGLVTPTVTPAVARAEQGPHFIAGMGERPKPRRENRLPPETARRPFDHHSVRGLLFDMGDVLYDATVWRRWLLQLLARMGMHAQYRSFYHLWDSDYLDAAHRGAIAYGDAFVAFLTAVGLTRGQIDEVEAASQIHKRELEGHTRPMPGVRTTIQRLHAAGIVLAVLSDSECTASVLQDRLAQLGLGGYFSTVISSFDLKQTKPHPVGYQTALAGMKLKADQVAFVGHDAQELTGAARAGMRTIAFNHEPGSVAGWYLDRFDGLCQIIPSQHKLATFWEAPQP